MTKAPKSMTLQPCPTYGWDIPDRVKYKVGPGEIYYTSSLTTVVLEAALERLAINFEKDENLNRPICCGGNDCGCQGSTAGGYAAFRIRELLADKEEIARIVSSKLEEKL